MNYNNIFEKMEQLFVLFKGLKALNDCKQKIKKKRTCAVRKINRTRNRFGYFKLNI